MTRKHRNYVETTDSRGTILHMLAPDDDGTLEPSQGESRMFEGWHARVMDWEGHLVYDGPCPVPDDLCTVSLDDALAGRVFTFEMSPA
jgi:hypothetical protein